MVLEEAGTNCFPGDGLGSGVELRQAACDLDRPCLFDLFGPVMLDALEEQEIGRAHV